jgi:YggT family protein
MSITTLILFFLTRAVTAVVVAGIALILLRTLFNYLEVNPFKWSARTVRRLTDPVISPVRIVLIGFRLDPKVAPFIAVILMIVAGYLLVLVVEGLVNTIGGVVYATTSREPDKATAIIGYLLYGLLSLYTLAIFVRIFFSWIGVGYGNRMQRLLIRTTEPLLAPLRRYVPAVGMFDISPIVAFLILWVCQAAVIKILLPGWKLSGF